MTERRPTKLYTQSVVTWMLLGGLMIGVSVSGILPKKLVWNASKSVPIGFYMIESGAPIRGDLVLVGFPKWVSLITSQRDYLLPGLPALKFVSALSGDVVCRREENITINGSAVATAYLRDNLDRKMPVWMGCQTLKVGEVFLLTDHTNSFDGRYFGVSEITDVMGIARPIWINVK